MSDAGGGSVRASFHGPLRTALQARVAILVGVVYLMTVKPGPVGSLVTMVVALAAAVASAAINRRGAGGG